MAEVIEKAGLIERSGQGVDIMFANCINEGRLLPDYSASDDFQVVLRIETKIAYPQLRRYLKQLLEERTEAERLNVFDLITLYSILRREGGNIYERSVRRLLDEGLILNHDTYGYIMGNGYFAHSPAVVANAVDADTYRRLYYLLEDEPKSMSSFLEVWRAELTVKQIRTKIENLVGTVLSRSGNGRGTKYSLLR